MQRSDDTKENINTGTDILKIGVGILNGFLGLLQVKIGIIRSLGSLLINTVKWIKTILFNQNIMDDV